MQKLLIGAIALFGAAPFANAGDCPPDQVVAAATTGAGHAEGIGVTDVVLAVNDLGAYHPELASRDQRVRMLTIEPGGEVPWHSHADRPALIYVVSGEVVEYRSTCAEPIVHRVGEVATEIGALEHWWRNESADPAVLIAADLPRAE